MAKPANRTANRGHVKPFGKGFDPRRNLKGRPKISPEARRLRELNMDEFTTAVNKIISMRITELEKLCESADGNVLDVFIGRLFLAGIKGAHRNELEFFLDRLIGKVADNVNHNGNFHGALMSFIQQRKDIKNGQQEKDARKTDEGSEEEDGYEEDFEEDEEV